MATRIKDGEDIITEEEKNRQIPAVALMAVRDRMEYGFKKHGDYKKRLEGRPKHDLWEHAVWHMNELKKGNKFTGSGDSHVIAVICDLMMFYEKELEDASLT